MKIKELFETDEMIWGCCIGLGFIPIIQGWAVLLSVFTAVLTRLGGLGWLETKAWRRFGVPTAVALTIELLKPMNLLAMSGAFVISAVLLSLGYGTKSPNDPGSPFGNFFLNLALKYGVSLKSAEIIAHLATRTIIVVGIWLSWGISLVLIGR